MDQNSDLAHLNQSTDATKKGKWKKTMVNEIQSMKSNKVWNLVSKNVKVIDCKWLL